MNKTLKITVSSLALFGALSLCAASPIVFANETLTPLQQGRFSSKRFGEIAIQSASQDAIVVWSPAANAFLQHRADGSFSSWELGDFKIGPSARWLHTDRFGWVHIGENEQTFGGWIFTEKYGWVKIERPNGTPFFWIPKIRSWAEVDKSGNFFSFEWGYLTQTGENRFTSSRFGAVTTGEFDGWVKSDLFGWLWAPGGGKWFWAAERNEWLGILPDGQVWSTAENKVLVVTPPAPPLEQLIGPRGPRGGFIWKPVSESDHRLVVLLPASLTDRINTAWIADKDGNVVEVGRYVGAQHNGGREHYRFSKKGGNYGSNLYVVSRDRGGNLIHWPIPNGASRYDY